MAVSQVQNNTQVQTNAPVQTPHHAKKIKKHHQGTVGSTTNVPAQNAKTDKVTISPQAAKLAAKQ